MAGYNSSEVDYSDFYSGDMAPPVSNNRGGLVPRNNAGGLTTRPVKTIPIDGKTGLPKIPTLAASKATKPPGWTSNGPALFAIQQQLNNAPAQQWAVDANGQRIDPIALGYSGNPGALRPGGLTPPGWGAQRPPFGAALPVANAAPALQQAWADVAAGRPGAMDTYTRLLADAAEGGNIGRTVTGGVGKNRSLVPPRTSFQGSSTGREYDIGKEYATSQYKYRANPNGSFTRIGASGPGSSAERYEASRSSNNRGAGGYTSSGESRTTSSGESWAAAFGG